MKVHIVLAMARNGNLGDTVRDISGVFMNLRVAKMHCAEKNKAATYLYYVIKSKEVKDVPSEVEA